jgi:hypothetical protein
LVSFVLSGQAFAGQKSARWTAADDANGDLAHVVSVLNSKTGLQLQVSDFVSIEDLDLATSHFKYLAQAAAGVVIKGMSLRTWTDLKTGATIQVEALVDDGKDNIAGRFRAHAGVTPTALINSQAVREGAMKLVRQALKGSDDSRIRSLDFRDVWVNGDLVREFTVKAAHGTHRISVSLAGLKLLNKNYEQYPQADAEYSAPIDIFQIYEETNDISQKLDRIPSVLKYLYSKAVRVDTNPYVSMQDRQYTDVEFDPVLGMTDAGRAQGFWSMTYLKREALAIRATLPETDNFFNPDGSAATDKGVILEGRYATINLNPDAVAKFGPQLDFTPGVSAQMRPNWIENADGSSQMIPQSTFLGRPLASIADIVGRPARRLPDHDPATYLKDGFDEMQVYWAITTLFDDLHAMGFNDPELSTRRMNAYLYDPDITMRDNAYYTDDTINFTTYSSDQQNAARDNPTIWHELGHGVMDRLMGDMITLADTGGLSEGMADFVAIMVVNAVTQHAPFPGMDQFRIVNQTAFNLTNEVHDDGEAYGGTMRDFMESAIAAQGMPGLHKVADLVMENMRLTRDNPALTAGGWFTHMLFADSLGRDGVRAPNELHDLLVAALGKRNFSFDDQGLATYALHADGQGLPAGGSDIVGGQTGARDHEIKLTMKPTDTVTYHMSVTLKDGDTFKFQYPVTVAVEFKTHALQGAVHWVGEEQDPRVFTIQKAGDVLNFDLQATGQCDSINRPDGTCSDYAYVQIINNGQKLPSAKKRFYLRIKTQN